MPLEARVDLSAFKYRVVSCSGFWVLVLLLASAPGCSLCNTTDLKRVVSPDGAYTAFILANECGATVRDARQVTLTRGSALPKPGWSSSVIEEGTVFRIEGETEIDVFWTGSRSLTVRYRKRNAKDRIYREDDDWNGVRVTFTSAAGS
jgi:hypothetical protein